MNERLLEDWLDDPLFVTDPASGRPAVTLSYAQSIDGSLAAELGRPTAISGVESARATHMIRSRHRGILAGVGTVLSDNPRLNVRLAEGPDPLPVILDTLLRTPPDCRLAAEGARPLILCGLGAPAAAEARLKETGARVIRLKEDGEGRVDLRSALVAVLQEGIGTLMVEGGTAVLGAFLTSGFWDRAALTLAPLWLGGCGIPVAVPARLDRVQWVPAGDDVLCLGWRVP